MMRVQPRFTFSYAGAQINVYHASKGEGLPKHLHAFSHATMCSSGLIVVRANGKELVMDKDTKPVDLPAEQFHEIEALEDDTVFINVFAEGQY